MVIIYLFFQDVTKFTTNVAEIVIDVAEVAIDVAKIVRVQLKLQYSIAEFATQYSWGCGNVDKIATQCS